jgi:peptide deformylase
MPGTVREIRLFPQYRNLLTSESDPVDEVDQETQDLIQDMLKTMRAYRGVGISAPQVGISKRIIAFSGEDEEEIFVNPTIKNRTGHQQHEEGCLSLPGMHIEVERSDMIRVEGLDRTGASKERVIEGFPSAVVQHEIDHLDGVLLIDHINSPAERRQTMRTYRRHLKKASRRGIDLLEARRQEG